MAAQDALHHVGDIVALVDREGSDNGSGDGILWRVDQIKGRKLRVVPCWCATGATKLRPKWVGVARQHLGFVRLGELRMQLDDMCRQALAHEAGLKTEEG